ncbi:MAG: hypothetical protein ACOCP9_01230, partial [Halofilum sp. (in: g-proteobacteria)]
MIEAAAGGRRRWHWIARAGAAAGHVDVVPALAVGAELEVADAPPGLLGGLVAVRYCGRRRP